MKLNGKTLFGPRIEVIVFPRQDGNLVFKAQSVLDYDPFEKICPQPQPPVRMLPGGIKSFNTESPEYEEKLEEWATKKWDWMMLKSLEATEKLEWDTVNMEDPSTYGHYRDEMKAAGLSPAEISRIQALVVDSCGLNQIKIDEATKAFLAGQGQEQEDKSSPSSEVNSTPSGEPVSVLT